MPGHFSGASQKTAAKLVVLEEALDIYTKIILSNWDVSPWYIDTHAGTGKTSINDNITIDGSAIIALENHAEDFERFYFYELNTDHFHLLHETLSDRFGYEFEVSPVGVDGYDFLVARHDDPYIRILNQDSNDGAQFLTEHTNSDSHWFVFIDPKGLTARRDTLDALIQRGNVDVLLNYQSEGAMRSAAAEHAENAVTRQHGDDDWPDAGTPDEYVEAYKSKLEQNEEVAPIISEPFEDLQGNGMRFDLIFACQNSKVTEIIHGRMTQEDLWKKANKRTGQPGLGDFD